MTLETTHRGLTIRYSENADEWSCYEAGISHAKLSKVKQKIDGLSRAARKKEAVPAYVIGYREIQECTVIEVAASRRVGGVLNVWIMQADGLGKLIRRKVDLDDLAPSDDLTRAAIQKYELINDEAIGLAKVADNLRKAIPRLTADAIAALAQAAPDGEE